MGQKTSEHLQSLLLQLDQRGYKAYQELLGSYEFPQLSLIIDRVQSDPFAPPSQCRLRIPQAIAKFPSALYANSSREIALRDYLTRQFDQATQAIPRNQGTGNSGVITIAKPSQVVLERTSVLIDSQWLEVRFQVGLPAYGRRIAGEVAAEMLCDRLPQLVEHTLVYAALNPEPIAHHIQTIEDADTLRQQLGDRGLVAFVADGSILPRRSGVDQQPLLEQAIPFHSPTSLRVELTCPHRGKIIGMGIPAGVTLIVGGGYHGKSTLLKALELGIYNHCPGDGREFVVTNPTAVKIRAEDGRSIQRLDISPFINHLPQERSTTQFSTPNASGSTSQAANILEALEAGTELLLIDEDTAATNLMIRDRRMQALISKDKEPITPFLERVQQLDSDLGVSTILVMGGSGDYFDVADTVIAMTDFQPHDVTQQAKAIAQQFPSHRQSETGEFKPSNHRQLLWPKTSSARVGKWKVQDLNQIRWGEQEVDCSRLEQFVERGQLKAIAAVISYWQHTYGDREFELTHLLDQVMAAISTQGLDQFTRFPQGDLTLFRRFELAAVINRLR